MLTGDVGGRITMAESYFVLYGKSVQGQLELTFDKLSTFRNRDRATTFAFDHLPAVLAKKLPVTQEDMAHALSKDKPYLVVARRMRDPGDSDYNPWYDYKAVRASAEDLTGVIGRLDRENDGGHVRVGLELRLLPGGN